MELGKQIKHYRIKKGWTLEKLATKINYAKNTIHNWENNKREPDNRTIKNIANALGVSILHLFKEDGMMNMKSNEELRYIGTRHLEEMEPNTPEEVIEWMNSLLAAKQEAGYPAILNGIYGYMVIMEYWHDEIEDEMFEDTEKVWRNTKCKELLSSLRETAKLLAILEPNLKVFVGDRTAPLYAHELSIFLPFGTSNDKYKEILESWKYAEIKENKKRKLH